MLYCRLVALISSQGSSLHTVIGYSDHLCGSDHGTGVASLRIEWPKVPYTLRAKCTPGGDRVTSDRRDNASPDLLRPVMRIEQPFDKAVYYMASELK